MATASPRTRASRAVVKIEQAEQDLADAVADMRKQGMTWAEIADVLGVTRQSAWRRFGHLDGK